MKKEYFKNSSKLSLKNVEKLQTGENLRRIMKYSELKGREMQGDRKCHLPVVHSLNEKLNEIEGRHPNTSDNNNEKKKLNIQIKKNLPHGEMVIERRQPSRQASWSTCLFC